MPGKVCSVVVYGCVTDEQIAIINKAIISDPASGQYKITDIRFVADGSYVVTYDNTPIP